MLSAPRSLHQLESSGFNRTLYHLRDESKHNVQEKKIDHVGTWCDSVNADCLEHTFEFVRKNVYLKLSCTSMSIPLEYFFLELPRSLLQYKRHICRESACEETVSKSKLSSTVTYVKRDSLILKLKLHP